MINIVSYAAKKGTSGGSASGGGGGNVTNYNNYSGIEPLYLWGHYFDGTQDVDGDLTADGNIKANNIEAKNSIRANIIEALSATTEYFKTISIEASGDADIGGNTHIHQNLEVDGTSNLKGNTTISGSTSMSGDLSAGGKASIGGNTTISGSTSMTGDLYAGGKASIGGNTTISGSTSMTGDLYSGGSARINDNITIGGRASIGSDTTIGGNANVSGDTFVEGSSTVHHNLTTGGDATIYGNATISGTTRTTDIFSENITNNDTIRTKNLEVTGKAHFFELVIDKIKAAGGAFLLTPADGFDIDYVEDVTNGKKLYFRSTDKEGKGIMNMWEIGDQAICQSFNEAKVGTSYNVSNKYWWSVVTDVSEQPVQKTVSGETNDYHYITISTQEGYDDQNRPYYDGTVDPEVGDSVAMLGSRNEDDKKRQSAEYLSSYVSIDLGLTPPLYATYQGINDFNLAAHRGSYIDAYGARFVGELYVDANTSVQDYITDETTEIRNEFKFGLDGLTSRVEHKSRPNIVSNNDWHDQDNAPLYQENDEEYNISGTTECTAYPPVMYLNAGIYTPSIYGYGKFKDISYGTTKDNLDKTLSVETMINFDDTWNGLPRSQAIISAPFDGYYAIGIELMNANYTGDTEYIDYIEEQSSGSTSGSTIQTSVQLFVDEDVKVNRTEQSSVETYPLNYRKVFYRSSNPSAVTVDEDGNITGVGQGHALIYAFIPEEYSDGYRYLPSQDYKNVQCMVSTNTTTTIEVQSIIPVGSTAQVSSSITPDDYPGAVTYTSSNPAIIQVSGDTLVALSPGTATITASIETITSSGFTWNGSSDSVNVESKACIATTLTNNIPSTFVYSDTPITFTIVDTITPNDYPGEAVYTSSNPNIVDVSGHTLTVYGVGSATITGVLPMIEISGDTYASGSCVNNIDVHDENSNIEFEDAGVKSICVNNWDTNNDGELSYKEAAAVRDIGRNFSRNTSITSFDELQYFTGLTIIPDSAFYNCTKLASVTIPNTITSIEPNAFLSCSSLTNANIPNSVKNIRLGAFSLTNLPSVTIPESVTFIERVAFSFCRNMTSMSVSSLNTYYDSRDNCNAIIETATNTLIAGCKNTIIPNTVTAIGEQAFSYSNITSITIPNSVITIGDRAFDNCQKLASVTLGNCITSIGKEAFADCYPNITSITIPSSVVSIGDSAFYGSFRLKSVTILATTPPTLGTDAMKRKPDGSKYGTLYVPSESVNAYKAISGYADYFTDIIGL